jgi:hypothetical protein
MARVIPFAVPDGFKLSTRAVPIEGAKVIVFRKPVNKKSA